jgi:uncharacterized protein (TIGR02246 family)
MERDTFAVSTSSKEDVMRLTLVLAGFMMSAVINVAIAQDRAAIEGVNAKLADAFNKRDGTAVGKFYAEKAALLPDRSPMVLGRENITKFWSDALKGVSDVKLETVDLQPLAPDAMQEIGKVFYSVKSDGASQSATGKYVVIWRKEGSDWKISTDIWNNDK